MLLISPFIYPEKLLTAEHIAFVTESISAQPENVQKGPDSSKEVSSSLCFLHRRESRWVVMFLGIKGELLR